MLIQRAQPTLNMPWILKYFKTSGTKTFTSNPCSTGFKLMRRMHLSKQSYDFQLHQQHWTILFNLANTTLARYSASRILLRRSTPIKDIYALLRMSQHLDEPWRSRAQKQMQHIIRKRLETIPPRPCPFVIPFLCLPDFRSRLEIVLLNTIRRNHAVLLPLHWPTKKVVEGKHICLQNHVQNWRHWMAVMTWQSQPVCTCENFHDQVPNDCLFQGHIACPLSLLDLPDELKNLAISHSEEISSQQKKSTDRLFEHKQPAGVHCYSLLYGLHLTIGWILSGHNIKKMCPV